MKTIIATLFITLLFTGATYATGPNEAVAAKAANLTEVISNIEYPLSSRENGVEGRVMVLVKVNAKGEVTASKVISTPCKNLQTAVEEGMLNLKFSPARNANGEFIASTVKIPIDFKLTID
ncbi:MAG: TonB family protein [Cyclobacteriaceae bacterium]|jgi:TonB family protein